MNGVIHFTLVKLREPAYMIMFSIAVLLGYVMTGASPVQDEPSSSLWTQIITSNCGYSVLPCSFVALGITAIITVFTASTEIPREIDSGVIMLILSKPVSKTEYLLGKFIVTIIICLMIFLATLLTSFLTRYVYLKELYPPMLIMRQLYMFLPIIPLTALSITVSCFLSDISAMIIVAIYMTFSIFFSIVPLAIALLPKTLSAGVDAYILVFYYFFPNFIYFFQNFQLAGLISLALLFYTLSITVIFLMIGANRINTRDLTRGSMS